MNKEIKPPSRADTLVATRQTEQGKDTESDMGQGPQRCTWWGHRTGGGAARMGGPAGDGGGGRRAGDTGGDPPGALGLRPR